MMRPMDLSPARANAVLLLTAAIWGIAFVAQRAGMEHIGPLAFNAIRFFLGALVLMPFIARQRGQGKGMSLLAKKHFLGGVFLAAVCLFAGSTLQQVGLVYTSAGHAGFITGLYVVVVPIMGMMWGQRTHLNTWIGVFLAVLGMYLLTMKGPLGLTRGDFWVCLSVVFWSAHVHLIGWLSPRSNPFWLAALQFLLVSFLSGLGALGWEALTWSMVWAARVPIFYAGCLSVGVAYTLQVVGQRTAKPAHAAIILSLESAFAVLGGWILLNEVLSARGLAGCGLMLAGMIYSQLPQRKRKSVAESSDPSPAAACE